MIRKSLGVFVVCASLALAIRWRQQGSILLRNPSFPQLLSWTRTLLREAVAGVADGANVVTRGETGRRGNRRATLPVPVPGPHASAQTLVTRPAEEVQLPFVMELKRPRKMRFELQFSGQTAIQVFDGANGWKLRRS